MQMKNFCFLLSAMIATSTGCALSQGYIYEDTSPSSTGAFTALEEGNEVYAAGTARVVTQLQIGLSMQGYSGTADFVLRLYDNTGLGGYPGSLLWQSTLIESVPISGSPQLISFDVPNVLVPDIFTWTIQNYDATPLAVELDGAGSPSIGGNPSYSWFGGPGKWTELPGTIYMSRIVAVPEPSGTSLLCLALSILALRCRRRGC